MSQRTSATVNFEALKLKASVELSLNDLRILVGCFNALEYQSELDGETYLDPDAKTLHEKLESLYLAGLREAGGNGSGNGH